MGTGAVDVGGAKDGLSFGSRAALAGIWVYQRWISPYKGFRCAHAALHGGPGCSGYARQAIRTAGLWRGIGLVRQRFRECKAAMEVLTAQESASDGAAVASGPPRKKKNRWCTKQDVAIAGCEMPGSCCSATGSKGAAAGGAAAGAGAEATTGICGVATAGVGEAVGGACGAAAGVCSCGG